MEHSATNIISVEIIALRQTADHSNAKVLHVVGLSLKPYYLCVTGTSVLSRVKQLQWNIAHSVSDTKRR
jgi:hypothetical protein